MSDSCNLVFIKVAIEFIGLKLQLPWVVTFKTNNQIYLLGNKPPYLLLLKFKKNNLPNKQNSVITDFFRYWTVTISRCNYL